MIVLKPNSATQIFKAIARPNTVVVEDFTISLVDKITGNDVGVSIEIIEDLGDFIKVTATFGETGATLKEGRFYRLEIRNDNKIYFKDRVFVTDQQIAQVQDKTYDINKDVYKEQVTSDNDYIIL